MRRYAVFAPAFVLAAVFGLGPAQAAPSDAMAPVNQFVDGFNKSDAKMLAAACASPASILDDFPPHVWGGATGCADWFSDFLAYAKQSGFTDNIVTVGKPWHEDVTGNLAYIVVPTTYTYKNHGKPVSEAGVFTLVVKKTAAGWRITSWAWADH